MQYYNFLLVVSCAGLTVQQTKSGKCDLPSHRVWACNIFLWALGAAIQWNRPCCHPICSSPPTPLVTQIHVFVHQPKVSECTLRWQGPSVNTVASHGMLLFNFIRQTTSDTNRALWLVQNCGAFSHLAQQPLAVQHCGCRHCTSPAANEQALKVSDILMSSWSSVFNFIEKDFNLY